jgi:outer membrane lipoprotein
MRQHRVSRWILLSFYAFVAVDCAHPISRELRKEVHKDLTFPMVLEKPMAYVGSTVIWGGEIIKTTILKDATEILVLEIPLDYWGKPQSAGASRGRFIARSSQFLDPALYKEGKKITVAGEVTGKKTRPLGETEYTYPVVRAREVNLWESTRYRPYYDDYYGGPHFGGFYGYYSW